MSVDIVSVNETGTVIPVVVLGIAYADANVTDRAP